MLNKKLRQLREVFMWSWSMLRGISKKDYVEKQADKALEERSMYFNESINSLKDDVDEMECQISSVKANLGSFLSHINGQIEEFKIRLDFVIGENSGRLGDMSLELEAHKGRYRILEENFNSMKEVLMACDNEITLLWDELGVFERRINSFIVEWNGHLATQGQVFDRKLKEMEERILSRPSEVAELRREIKTQIELTTLNGQNSVLRCANNEKMIHILEKRLEQVFLLLKKNNLDEGM